MRLLPIAAAGLTVAVVGGAAGFTAVGASRQSAFAGRAASLQQRWSTDIREGVPPSAIQPLRQKLTTSGYDAPWWSPTWWTGTGSSLLDQLDSQTSQAWQSALDRAHASAQAALDSWTHLETSLAHYVPAPTSAAAQAWPAQLTAATTPATLEHLAQQWNAAVAAARQQAEAAQQQAQLAAALDQQVSQYGGVSGLLKQAEAGLSLAQADNLDAGALPALVTQLQQAVRTQSTQSSLLEQVAAALQSLHSLIALNDSVSGALRPLLLAADQASAEGVPGAGGFQSQYSAAAAALSAAQTAPELTAVQQQVSSALATVNAALTADKCGHAVGAGKVITINLTLQEAVFYQDGCELQAGPVTTGRPELRTPTGTFHVFYKQSPVHFVSPWPVGSPFYYVPSWTDWGMEFAGGGYFIHDAPWEPDSELGPGSENSGGASHGCVHLTHALMQWAYQWTPVGTPVIITN